MSEAEIRQSHMEQEAWIAVHGVTHCPPGPTISMSWFHLRYYQERRAAQMVFDYSEQDFIRYLLEDCSYYFRTVA